MTHSFAGLNSRVKRNDHEMNTPVSSNAGFTRPFFLGFFGAPNFGDELLSRTVVELFGPSAHARVATRSASVTRRTLRGTGAQPVSGKFPHLNFWTGLPRRLTTLSRASQLVIGGGGLVQDAYSTATIMTSAFDAAWIVRRRRPFIFVGLEIGEIRQPVSQRLARFLMREASGVWCRDQQSLVRANELGYRGTPVLAPDLAHWFLRKWARGRTFAPDDHCVINVRVLPTERPEDFIRLIELLCQSYGRVTLASAQPGEGREWVDLIGAVPSNLDVFESGHWEETLELLAGASTIIAERFHYIAAGAHLGLRVVPLLGTHKAADLADELGFGLSERVMISSYTPQALSEALDSATPVSPDMLDELAGRVAAAASALTDAATDVVRHDRAVITESRRITLLIMRAGVQWLWGGVLRRVKRAR